MAGGVALVLGLVLATSAAARPLAPEKVPEPLRPWIDWALAGHEEAACPFLGAPDTRQCAWPSRLELSLDEHGGRFTQRWFVYRESEVTLPGDEARWPQGVLVDDRPAIVTSRGAPVVHVEAGVHAVSGAFEWDRLPEILPTPPATGLVALAIDGAPVAFPKRDADGRLWLRARTGENDAEARLDVVVTRLVRDGIPPTLTTQVALQVAGKSREAVLARALPPDFVPLALASPLPARIEPDGHLRVQLRPGAWTITVTGRGAGRTAAITLPEPDAPWAVEEVWAVEAAPALRGLRVQGPDPIDPSQTMLPPQWRRLPAYRMRPGDTMQLVEVRRGDTGAAPDQLALQRVWWLDFDGHGYTVSDRVSGTASSEWRLEMAPPFALGRASVNGADQPITRREENGAAGVEIRERQLALDADARLEGDARRVPAVGWQHDFASVGGILNLPPGWRLVHARGVDAASPTWVSSWTLLDLFFVLVTAMAVVRLYGRAWGALALVALVLTYLEPEAPQWVWLAFLASEALVRVLPAGRALQTLRALRVAMLVVLVVVLAPYVLREMRLALHPSLEAPGALPGIAATVASEAESGGRLLARKGYASEDSARSQQMQRYKIDPGMRVQTGPGRPAWGWNRVTLRWQGPVERSQTMQLVLTPPWLNRLLGVLRVALVVLLFVHLLRGVRLRLPTPTGAAAGVAALVALAPVAVRAQFPSEELLEALRDRLLAPPACLPTCVGINRLGLEAHGDVLRIRLEVDAAADAGVALPGNAREWTPATVLLDRQPAPGLAQTTDGRLWLALAAGRHDVLLEGALPPRDVVSIPLPERPRGATATVDGWTVAGIADDGVPEANLQLTRTQRDGRVAHEIDPGTLPSFVSVSRRVVLGLTWEVDTTVERLSPAGTAIVLDVPLLAGEAVTSGTARAAGGRVAVSLAPQSQSTTWHSVLEQRERLELAAPSDVAWVERWTLDASPMWHVEAAGIPGVELGGEERVHTWWPWPGERVTVAVSRPAAVPGPTLTVDDSTLQVRPGRRATDATLSFTVRSSQGGRHRVGLPPGAMLQSTTVNDAPQPIRQEGDAVMLPIAPGTQRIVLAWRQSVGIGTRFVAPAVDLGTPSVNATTTIAIPESRWILAVGGPRLGPAVLFWSTLVAIALAAAGLGRSGVAPLGVAQWLLLGIGLSQVDVVAALVVVGWFVALAWRRREPLLPRWAFDLRQLVLVGWTLVVVGILFAAVRQGLLGAPDMQIAGNGSSADELRWYVDRTGAVLPQPWVFSVPLYVYRLAMLAWSVWIAVAVVGRWLRWAWDCFSAGGLWQPLRGRVATTR